MKSKEPSNIFNENEIIKIEHRDSFVELLNQEIEELQRSMEKDEQERNNKTIK